MSSIRRRDLFRLAGAGSLALASFPVGLQRILAQPANSDSGFDNSLYIPPLDSGVLVDTVRSFKLDIRRGTSRFLPGLTTATLGINGDYLGPVLKLRRGEQTRIGVANRLDEPTSLHWHGFHIPAVADGGPRQQIDAGATWEANFQVRQQAGTFWYHSHVLHNAGRQVYQGLAGMIIVEDDDSAGLELPVNYGVDDIPVIVQDRRFGSDGELQYLTRYEDNVIGMHGDTLLVNGTWRPFFEPTTRQLRLRLLNAANARSFLFAFSDGRQFYQIASDGGLLNEPLPMTQLELMPAERAEILVDCSDGREATLTSLPLPNGFQTFPGALSRMMRSLNTQGFDVLHLRPAQSLAGGFRLPSPLASVERPTVTEAMTTRPFRLSMGFGSRGGNDRGPGTGARNGLGGGYGGGHSLINGRVMAMDFINETIPLDSTEIWELSNNSPMAHPFHVHHGQFRILDRNGAPPPANELGWKDTVKVGSGETVRIVMQFQNFADPDNAYMYHCHILEHEDQGMMGQFIVI